MMALTIDACCGLVVLIGVALAHRQMNRQLLTRHWSRYLLVPALALIISVPLRVGGLNALVFGVNPAWLYVLMSTINVTMQEYFTFGLLQSYVRQRFSAGWTIGIVAVLFYAVHAVLIPHKFAPIYWQAALMTLALGLLFAFFRHKTGSFYLSWALHLAFFFVVIS